MQSSTYMCSQALQTTAADANCSTADDRNLSVFANSTDNYYVKTGSLTNILSVITPILFGLIIVIGLVGNSLVMYVIITRDGMRTKINVLLFNLAMTDILFLLICPTTTITDHIEDLHEYVFDLYLINEQLFDNLCKLSEFCINVTHYVTAYTLVAISAIRYIGMVHPDIASKYITKKSLIMASCAMWITMLAANFPILFVYKLFYSVDSGYICSSDSIWYIERLRYTAGAILAYLLPLLAIALFNFGILRHVRKNVMTSQRESREHQSKVERLLLAVVVVFAVCWLPIYVQLHLFYWLPSYVVYPGSVRHALFVLSQSLAYSNSLSSTTLG